MGSLPHLVEDCMGVVQLYSDGSISRSKEIQFPFPAVEDESIVFKDCLFDKTHNLHLRLYKPKSYNNNKNNKLPILLFLHGGGFCLGARDWPNMHASCMKLSSGLCALVLAPDYRLAPEHRLPAPLEDAEAALRWVQVQALSENYGEAWLKGGEVYFDRVFVVGDSSGGNMAHHVAVRLALGSMVLDPVRVRRYVLMAPFFGGVERTKSEEGPSEEFLSLEILDRIVPECFTRPGPNPLPSAGAQKPPPNRDVTEGFWRLSLPIGETRDHQLANPFGPSSLDLEAVGLGPMLVLSGGDELLRDRAKDYASRLKKMGKKIEYVEFQGHQHGFFTNFPYSALGDQVIEVIKNFMAGN